MLNKIILVILSVLLFNKGNAGTHICYIYKGMIGSDSILLNLQLENLPPTKKSHMLNVNGVYIYKKNNLPITLLGSLDLLNKELVLKEVIGGKNIAVLKMGFSEKLMTGNRIKTNSTHSQFVRLCETANLIDTAAFSNKILSGVEIIQDTSLKNYLLVGVYSKMLRYYDAEMDQIKLIDKKTGNVFQIIDLSSVDTPSGVVIENIFKNVEIIDHNKDGYDDIAIWNNAGKWKSHIYIYYNPLLKKFELNPKPELIFIERHFPEDDR